MNQTFDDLPDWVFDMDEASAGVFEVFGRDSMGRTVSAKGIDLDLLLAQCRLEARKTSAQTALEIRSSHTKLDRTKQEQATSRLSFPPMRVPLWKSNCALVPPRP